MVDTAGAGFEDNVPTGGAVLEAIGDAVAELDSTGSGSSAHVAVTVVQADGVITDVSVSDTAAAADHVHGNISNDGKVGSVSGKYLVTGENGVVEAGDLPVASTSAAGIVRLSRATDSTSETMAATPKAVHDAVQATVAGLDATNSVPGGHYITSVDETDGIVSITTAAMDDVPTQDSSKPVKSGGVFASIGAAIGEVGGWLGNLTVAEVNTLTMHKKGDSATLLDSGTVMPGNVSVSVGDDIMWMDGLQVWQVKITDDLHHDNTLVGTGSTNDPIGVNPQEVVTSDSLTNFVEQETDSSDHINIVTSVTASNGKLKVKNKYDIGLYFIGSAHRMGFGTYWEG